MNPINPDFEEDGRRSFAAQPLMATLGASIAAIRPGEVEIDLPFQPHILQQHGFVHAGALISVVDTACGFAAFTLMPKGAGVLTVELKVNLMAPAIGDRLLAIGRVVRPGRTLTVTLGEVWAIRGGERKQVVLTTATMMVMTDPAIRG